MQYDFLKKFPRRMKNVGLYTVLLQNILQKNKWKQYGFMGGDEQVNLVFAVLLYIMEQSLKEENCTMDDIGVFIDQLNQRYYNKMIGYEDCKKLGDFIVNTVLSNDGVPMYFDGYDFEQKAYQILHISYVANKVVYLDNDIKRTSYYLTDNGYTLMLGTLEIENNMQITIHEMIFKLHLDRQSYDKAVDEIKNVFNLMRIQLQKIQEAMGKIRRNALQYSVDDYESLLNENMETIGDTKKKFQSYRELVQSKSAELEEKNINVEQLDTKEEENLQNLKIIEAYLNRTIDEHQKILNQHFDLKALYDRELEQLSRMELIKRFPIGTDLYDKILKQPESLGGLHYFLRPLFNRQIDKIYNLNKAVQFQKPTKVMESEESEEMEEVDEEEWRKDKEAKLKKRLLKYEGSLGFLLDQLALSKEMSLSRLHDIVQNDKAVKELFVPEVGIFKEIMVDLIKSKEIDIVQIQKEREEFIQDTEMKFQLNDMILNLLEKDNAKQSIARIEIYRIEDDKIIAFDEIPDEDGINRTIRCSNILFRIVERGDM